MKASNKVIEDLVKEVAGEDVIPLVNALKNKKNVSEFKLAEKIKEEVNITRNMLYRLHDANLVSFIRRKDKVKGWYIYYWTFKSKGIKYLIVRLKQKKLAQLKERIEREETGQFYLCPDNCMRLNFDQAFDFNFKCPECGTIMEMQDNIEKITGLKTEMNLIEEELKEANKKKPATMKVGVKKPMKLNVKKQNTSPKHPASPSKILAKLPPKKLGSGSAKDPIKNASKRINAFLNKKTDNIKIISDASSPKKKNTKKR